MKFVEDIQYQGLDLKRIAALVLKYGAKEGDVRRDIKNMVIIGIEGGNKLTKIISKSSGTIVAEMKRLRKVYRIVDFGKGRRDAITLSSLAY